MTAFLTSPSTSTGATITHNKKWLFLRSYALLAAGTQRNPRRGSIDRPRLELDSSSPSSVNEWVPRGDFPAILSEKSATLSEMEAYDSEVSIYEDLSSWSKAFERDEETDPLCYYFGAPSWMRLKRPPGESSPEIEIDTAEHTKTPDSYSESESDPTVLLAERVAASTFRWCRSFVLDLNLCPWAKASLQTENAIRIKVVLYDPDSDPDDRLDFMERVVRRSSVELLKVCGKFTPNDDDDQKPAVGVVDPNVAITFVIAVPSHDHKTDDPAPEFQFQEFQDFVFDLEDAFLDDAEEAASEENSSESTDPILTDERSSLSLLGDFVTLAPFHPDWQFYNPDSTSLQPIDFEKRSPYPTVSIVLTEAIIAGGGQEATERIGTHNKDVLDGIGTEVLRDIFLEKVRNENGGPFQ